MKRSRVEILPFSPTRKNNKQKQIAATKRAEAAWNSYFSSYGVDDDDEEHDRELEQALQQSLLSYRNQLAVDYKQKGVIRSNPLKHITKSTFYGRVSEKGESSTAFSSCSVCKDARPRPGFIADSNDCDHIYCRKCIPVYLGQRINDLKDITKVKCPEPSCGIEFYYEGFRDFIPEEVMDRWRAATTESSVLYKPLLLQCPFQQCGKEFVDDKRGFQIRACPYCRRVFCLVCRVGWHLGKSCEEFQAELRIEEELRRFQELIEEELRRFS